MLKLVSFHIQAHLNAFLQILEYFPQSVDVDGLNLLAYSVFEFSSIVRGVFLYTFSLQYAKAPHAQYEGVLLPIYACFESLRFRSDVAIFRL